MGEFLQPYLVILLESNSVIPISQFFYFIYGYLFFRCLEKVFEEERIRNKEGNSRGITTSQLPQKTIAMMKFLALTLHFLARITLTLISFSAIIDYFQKVNFQGFNLVTLNFELSSVFLYASCQLGEKQAVLCGNNIILLKTRQLAFCDKSLYKSYQQTNFAFCFQI